MPGIPRAAYMPFPFQIVQSPQTYPVANEFPAANRVVNMGKPTEGAPAIAGWAGRTDSWEGDTLVIEDTGPEWSVMAGSFHAATSQATASKVTERFTRPARTVSCYEATIDRPHKSVLAAMEDQLAAVSQVEKNAQFLEFKCVEFAEELLYGKYRKQ